MRWFIDSATSVSTIAEGTDNPRYRFEFDDNVINQVNPLLEEVIPNQRFVGLKDVVYDFRSELAGFEERCEFVQQFDDCNLSSATGTIILATGPSLQRCD